MITVISGTNRPRSNTRKVAVQIGHMLSPTGEETTLIDLADLPSEIFSDTSYASKPGTYATYQDHILDAAGVQTVDP